MVSRDGVTHHEVRSPGVGRPGVRRHWVRSTRRARMVLGGIRDVVSYGNWTGRWWLPLMIVLAIGVLWLMIVGQTVVPTAVYTLF